MSDMEQLRKQQQEMLQKAQEIQQQQQTTGFKQDFSQQQTQQTTQDIQAIQQNIAANPYLQSQRDADAAAPDDNQAELLARQMTVGLGKHQGIQKATNDAADGQ